MEQDNRSLKKSFIGALRTCWWVFKTYFSISPLYNSLYLCTRLVGNTSGLVNSFLLGLAIDRMIVLVQNSGTPTDFIPIFLPIILAQLVFSLISDINSYAAVILGNLENQKLQKILADKLSRLKIEDLEDPEVANRVQRFNEIYSSFSSLTGNIINLLSQFTILFSAALIVSRIVPLLLPIVFLASFFEWSINQYFLRKIWLQNRTTTQDRRRANASIATLIDPVSLKELTIVNGTSFLMKKFTFFFNKYIIENIKIRTRWYIFLSGNEFVQALIYAVSLFFIFLKFLTKAVSIGQLTFLLRSVTTFAETLSSLGTNIVRIRESSIRFDDIKLLFDMEENQNEGTIHLDSQTAPTIEFKNVNFTYPRSTKVVIKDLNLSIKPGEKIAIVGENGAGKTTLVKLLTRFYQLNSGGIFIDKYNINDVKIDSWYKILGVLFQDYNQYGHLTLKDNIRIGAPFKKHPTKKIKKALTDSQADFISEYKNGFKQILSERFKDGIRPSTGQWQKIAIARFFYRNAPVLILDEPTASIDAISEAQIFDNIYKFMKGKTVIIISHRFSTVRNADRILVLDKGKIIEEGSHEELLKKEGKYAQAFHLQAKGYS